MSRQPKSWMGVVLPAIVAFIGVSSALEAQETVSARLVIGTPVERIAARDAGTPAFAWPIRPEQSPGAESPLPASMGYREWPECRAALVTDLYRRCGRDRLADFGDAVLMWPELLFDEVSSWMGSPSGRPDVRTWDDFENRSVTSRMMDIQVDLRQLRISTVFLTQWIEREQKYLGEFEDSRVNTVGFANRTEGADLRELGIDQRKLVLDALRRTYLARYKMKSDESIPEEAWALKRWNGLDFAVLPPLVGGLIYFRGLNKRFSMGETALRVAFEPVSELLDRKHDRAVAAALEWTVKGFPVGIIVSAGLHDGRYAMDFIGIGTSIGAARTAVEYQLEAKR